MKLSAPIFLPLTELLPITHSISNNSLQVADKWAGRVRKIPASLPLKEAGLPQVGAGYWMLNQMQSFGYSLRLDILIYILRVNMRLKISNSGAQIAGLPLFVFISAFKSPIVPCVHLFLVKLCCYHMVMPIPVTF